MKTSALIATSIVAQSVGTLGYTAWSYTNQSELPYYGLSPPVYPSPIGNGSTSLDWEQAYSRAQAIVAQLTIEEKVNLTQGFDGPCVGNVGAVPRLGIGSLCLGDGPDGVRAQEFVSAFPAGIHVAATWDRTLMYQYGHALGEEFKGKGINVALGPVAAPLGRIARGGRNWEGFGPDPCLTGAGMGAITKGIQDVGVIATAKHWLLYEQQYRRNPDKSLGEAISSNADDRTIHELYVFPFMDSLRENVGAVMTSYQRVNNSYSSQNSKLLNGILKNELGFQGFVMSDWDGQHAGVASANAGLDLVMPDAGFWGGNLTAAVRNGSVAMSRLDDMATRQLAAFYLLKQDEDYPSEELNDYDQKHKIVDVQADHAALIREIGAAGHVLVKNTNNTLPLKKPRYLTIYGYDATVPAAPWTTPERYMGIKSVILGWNTFNGTLITGGGSGAASPPYVVSPFQALQERITQDKGILRWDFYSEDPSPPFANSEACLVFINAFSAEAYDRPSLTDSFSDKLIRNVATNCSKTIVIVHNAGIRVVDEWIDHPNVTAVVFAGLPGQESGYSLVDVLYGDVNPSGRLPFTIARNETDYGSLLNSTVSSGAFPQANFTEGLFIDYRMFDQKGIEPRFEFGFGLSYTTFDYSNIAITPVVDNQTLSELPDPAVAIQQGGHPELWSTLFFVSCNVTNSGSVFGHEVPQVYVSIPKAPIKQLRGFDRVSLAPNETKLVTFRLTRRDLSIWDVVTQQWRLQNGQYTVWIGASSRDLRLNDTLTV